MTETESTRLSLAGQLEALITEYYYARGTAPEARRRCYKAGLQVPLWLWTHESSSKEEMKEKELRKAAHLVEWILQQQVDPTKLAVLMPLEWRKDFRVMLSQQLQRRYRAQGTAVPADTPEPTILTHYELTTMQRRDKVRYHYDVVLYVFGLFPSTAAIAEARRQEENLTDALAAATHAFVLSMDAGWTVPALQQPWPQWRSFLEKLVEEPPFISSAMVGAAPTDGERLPSLVGSSLPICCSHHPEQRQLVHGVTGITVTCKHLCLHPYDCGRANHICTAQCHAVGRDHHHMCPYACDKPMPCGHPCLAACSARCNCYQVIEAPLRCEHQEVIGLDKASLEPIYATVHHVFKGVCADREVPCAVQYTTDCMRCLGKFTVKCHEAQAQGHTLHHKTMVCDPCKRTERELRASILGDVLCATEEDKKKLKVDVARTLHEQRKAASQGLFKVGTRVVIRDATRCVAPISAEDDFPGLSFVDMDDPQIFTELDGAYGTFVSSHVDVMDNSEVRNLVRLPDGHHVLVTDGGLDMIRALTTELTGVHQQRLLLTASSAGDMRGTGDQQPLAAQATLSPDFAAARALVGQRMYVARPVPCAALEDGLLADRVVVVRDVDPASPLNVLVECVLCTARPSSTAAGAEAQADGTPGQKRPRAEDGPADGLSAEGEAVATPPPSADVPQDALAMTVSCPAPIDHLEEMSGLSAGHLVNVTCPERQVTDPRDLELLAAALRLAQPASTSAPSTEPLVATPMNADTAYELVAIVNPPLHMAHKTGPCAVLRTRPHAVKMVAPRALHARHGGGRGGGSGATRQTTARPRVPVAPAAAQLLAVPFMFLAADELTEAEKALDAAAQRQYERRVEEAIQQASEDKALRNDEDEFHRQQQMSEVTAAVLQQTRTAYSAPTPLPSTAELAEAKVRFTKLVVASSSAARMTALKDKLVSAQETKAQGTFLATIQDRLAKDQQILKVYLEEVNRRLQGK